MRERDKGNGRGYGTWLSGQRRLYGLAHGDAVAVANVPAGASPAATQVRAGEGRTK
jgi:hypothetical protein